MVVKPGRQQQRRRRTGGPDRAARSSETLRHSPGRDLRVHVDRVVIEGLPRSDGALLGRAFERELVELLRTRDVAGDVSRTIDRIDAGEIHVSRHDSVATVAARLARTIGERIEP